MDYRLKAESLIERQRKSNPLLIEEIYKALRKEHIKEDALSYITDNHTSPKPVKEYSEEQNDVADAIAERLVYQGDMDENLTCWDNISNQYDQITTADTDPEKKDVPKQAYFFYGMRTRGYSLGAQPEEGFVQCLQKKQGAKEFYDVIVYNRPLTEDEKTNYSLTPLNACIIIDDRKLQDILLNTDYEKLRNEAEDIMFDTAYEYAWWDYCCCLGDGNCMISKNNLSNSDREVVGFPDSGIWTKAKIYKAA